ncbi:hypothetical protein CFBP5875_04555 [Agrobacterium pusense]|uniref:hypothetical protein n=1 Tax=Agrobacterium pusense TaxID=648995 RepID=UPI0010BF19A3|nr:hypothetical protein [Agrobacterium pusense]QCL83889.1 hypothetical protein CFBP5875_04555 [Agrobacterium pusense]
MDWQTFTSVWGFNYAALFALLVTFGLAYWSYWMLPKSRLAYAFENSTIVSETNAAFSDSITVSYNGVEIPRATLTKVYVWNDGNQTIRRADITPKKPLALTVPGNHRILQRSVASMADSAMDVALSPEDQGAISISFEYLEPRQGFICDVLHTGANEDLELSGILISAKTPKRTPLPYHEISGQAVIVVFIMALAVPLSTIDMIVTYLGSNAGPFAFLITMLLSLGGIIAWGYMLLGFALRRGLRKIDFGKRHTATPS